MQTTRVFRSYQKLLGERPYLIQSLQTASLMSVGDVISQSFIEKKSLNQIDLYRVAKFGSIGFLLGPALTSWYRFLDKLNFKTMKFVLLQKIALDQLVFAPCAIAGITTIVSLTDGKSPAEIKDRLRVDFFPILMNNYKLWPFVQYVNFSIVPLDYRVLVTQLVAIGWNTYLAWKLNSDKT